MKPRVVIFIHLFTVPASLHVMITTTHFRHLLKAHLYDCGCGTLWLVFWAPYINCLTYLSECLAVLLQESDEDYTPVSRSPRGRGRGRGAGRGSSGTPGRKEHTAVVDGPPQCDDDIVTVNSVKLGKRFVSRCCCILSEYMFVNQPTSQLFSQNVTS